MKKTKTQIINDIFQYLDGFDKCKAVRVRGNMKPDIDVCFQGRCIKIKVVPPGTKPTHLQFKLLQQWKESGAWTVWTENVDKVKSNIRMFDKVINDVEEIKTEFKSIMNDIKDEENNTREVKITLNITDDIYKIIMAGTRELYDQNKDLYYKSDDKKEKEECRENMLEIVKLRKVIREKYCKAQGIKCPF